MSFDAPGAVVLVESEAGDSNVAAIDGAGIAGDADEASPGAGADQRTESRLAEQPWEHVAAGAGPPVDEHALRARVARLRHLPVLAVSEREPVGDRSIEQFDETIRQLPATVPSFIDDECVHAALAVELSVEVVLSVHAGVGHVDVADPSIAGFFDVGAVAFDPGSIADSTVITHRLDDHMACIVVKHRMLADRQLGVLAGRADEGVEYGRARFAALHGADARRRPRGHPGRGQAGGEECGALGHGDFGQ